MPAEKITLSPLVFQIVCIMLLIFKYATGESQSYFFKGSQWGKRFTSQKSFKNLILLRCVRIPCERKSGPQIYWQARRWRELLLETLNRTCFMRDSLCIKRRGLFIWVLLYMQKNYWQIYQLCFFFLSLDWDFFYKKETEQGTRSFKNKVPRHLFLPKRLFFSSIS